MSCECYQIGGPFIAEDPSCTIHGVGGIEQKMDEQDEYIQQLESRIEKLLKLVETIQGNSE